MPSLTAQRPAEDPTATFPEPRAAGTTVPGGGRVGLALVGPDGRWAEVDAELCDVLGRGEAELTRCPVEAVLHPADGAEERVRHGRLLAGVLGGYRAQLRPVCGGGGGGRVGVG